MRASQLHEDPQIHHWVLGVAFDKMPGDALTREAVATAASHMIDLTDADTLVVTHVTTESKGSDEICATVYARAVVLKKAIPATAAKPLEEPQELPRSHRETELEPTSP